MKILFVWTGVTSYMADCWRTLAACPDVELKIVIADRAGGYGTAFRDEEVMRGLDWRRGEFQMDEKPDILFIVGWRHPVCRAYATYREWGDVPKVCCFDMPWEWRFRKIVARFALAFYLRRFKAAFVPGEVSAWYARWLGFSRVYRGLFGIDTCRMRRAPGPRREWREKANFLYVGRLSAEKNIDVLAAAYGRYRQSVREPVGLDVYGIGACDSLLKGIPGVVLHGFAQPEEMPGIYAHAKALVLPSAWDPWPLAIAESCAAGLPVICSDHCWNASELLRENAHVVSAGDVQALTRALCAVASLDGESGRELVEAYSCENWVRKVMQICSENL